MCTFEFAGPLQHRLCIHLYSHVNAMTATHDLNLHSPAYTWSDWFFSVQVLDLVRIGLNVNALLTFSAAQKSGTQTKKGEWTLPPMVVLQCLLPSERCFNQATQYNIMVFLFHRRCLWYRQSFSGITYTLLHVKMSFRSFMLKFCHNLQAKLNLPIIHVQLPTRWFRLKTWMSNRNVQHWHI